MPFIFPFLRENRLCFEAARSKPVPQRQLLSNVGFPGSAERSWTVGGVFFPRCRCLISATLTFKTPCGCRSPRADPWGQPRICLGFATGSHQCRVLGF